MGAETEMTCIVGVCVTIRKRESNRCDTYIHLNFNDCVGKKERKRPFHYLLKPLEKKQMLTLLKSTNH